MMFMMKREFGVQISDRDFEATHTSFSSRQKLGPDVVVQKTMNVYDPFVEISEKVNKFRFFF